MIGRQRRETYIRETTTVLADTLGIGAGRRDGLALILESLVNKIADDDQSDEERARIWMDNSTRALLLEIAGFLSMLTQGIVPGNALAQAEELLNKIGVALNGLGAEAQSAHASTD